MAAPAREDVSPGRTFERYVYPVANLTLYLYQDCQMSLLMISPHAEKDRVSTGVLEKFLFVVVIFVQVDALFQSIVGNKGIQDFRTIACPAPLYRKNPLLCFRYKV